MQSTQVAKDLSEIIDALEAGLLRLRDERDRLREAVESAPDAPGRAPAKKTEKPAAKKTARKAVKKAVKKAAKKKAAKKAVPAPETVAAAPKAPAKSRPALGRTLTMIRSPRPQNP